MVPPYQTVVEDGVLRGQEDASRPLDGAEVWRRRKRVSWKFYVLAAILYVIIDIPWLLGNAKAANRMVQNIQGSPLQFKALPALPVYVALSFIVSRANVRLEAFLLGVSTYAVFEFTCLSMFEDYSPAFALADSAWGGVLTLAVFSILHWKPVEKLLL